MRLTYNLLAQPIRRAVTLEFRKTSKSSLRLATSTPICHIKSSFPAGPSNLTRAYSSSSPSPLDPNTKNDKEISNDQEILLEAGFEPTFAISTTPTNTGNPIPDSPSYSDATEPTDILEGQQVSETSTTAFTVAARKQISMASSSTTNDDDYMAFLNKANASSAPPAQAAQQQQQPPQSGFKSSDADVPSVLVHANFEERFYVSDADEPFEPVSFRTSHKGLLDISTFCVSGCVPPFSVLKTLRGCVCVCVCGIADTLRVLNTESFKSLVHPPQHAHVERLTVEEFDPRGEYADVVAKVKEAGGGEGEVSIFKVEVGRSRVVYWLLGVDGDGGRVVGVRVVAVES